MDPNSFRMFMAAAGGGADEPAIGDAYEGGFFAGYISHTANSVATHRLILSPKSSGESSTALSIESPATTLSGMSHYDGVTNTGILSATGNSDAADFAEGLTIDGYTDWYIGTLVETQIIYFHLKPATWTNWANRGTNSYQVPERTTHWDSTSDPGADPAQTTLTDFQDGGNEALEVGWHWTSKEAASNRCVEFHAGNGRSRGRSRTSNVIVRAIRREAI